jgi:hypothetical protein
MTLGTPLALLLSLIGIPIVIFYILKVRLRRVPVSTNLFWNQLFEEKPPRALWRNLRYWISLLAQLLILTGLVLAIADPILSWRNSGAQKIVLIMDVSASMQATDIEPTRFDAAKKAAQRFLDGVREQDSVAIVATGPQPEVLLGMGNHLPSLRRAIENLSPIDAATSVPLAIELSKQLIGNAPNGRIIAFTDEIVDHEWETNPEQLAIECRSIGSNASNVGIVKFQSRRSMVDALGYELLIEVLNASDEAVECRLEIDLDQRPVDVFPLKLAPNETWTRTIEKTSLEGGVLKAMLSKFENNQADNLSKSNQLRLDDTAWAILPGRVIQPVLIVSPGNFFLQKVFAANPLVRVQQTNQIPETWPQDAVVVLHKLMPDKLPPNPLMIIDPDTSTSLFRVDGLIDSPLVTDQDKASPLMTHVRLDNVTLPSTKKLSFIDGSAKPIASSVGGDPIFATLQQQGSKCVVLSVNLEQSDLAFRTVFPILASNAIAWFTGQSGELSLALAGGQTVRLESASNQSEPITDAPLWLVSPDKQVNLQAGRTLGPLQQIGVWELFKLSGSENASTSDQKRPSNRPTAEILAASGEKTGRYAVNLQSSLETNIRRKNPVGHPLSATREGSWFTYPIWLYLAALIGILLVIEWGLYQRRVLA